jgi:hypothetical protein
MVWVYGPLTKKEKGVKHYLDSQLRKTSYNEKILKIMELYIYLKKKNYTSPKDIQNDIFYDKAKKHPVFNEEEAEMVFRGLKKRGGAGNDNEYKHTEAIITNFSKYIKDNYVPSFLETPIEYGIGLSQMPVNFVKGVVGDGSYRLMSTTVHGLIETFVSGVNGVAGDVGGPIGLAVVVLFTGIAASIGSILAFAEGNFAQSIIHFITFLPGIGPAIVKLLTKAEHANDVILDSKDEIENIPFVGQYIVDAAELGEESESPEGGKRFSTRKNNKAKWPKRTRRKLIRLRKF